MMLNFLLNKGNACRVAALALLIFALAGCGGPYPDLSNYELQEILWSCKSKSDTDMTPAMGVKCNNAKRECEIRKKDSRISSCA